jgi:hypothetical protein
VAATLEKAIHFGTTEIAPKLVELVQTELVAGHVGVPSEIAEVLHEDDA